MTAHAHMRRRVMSLLSRKGVRVTATQETVGTDSYDPTTGIYTEGDPDAHYVTGRAMRIDGDPARYEALGLVQSEAPTLIFAPDVEGVLPSPGAAVSFGNAVYTVRDVDPVAPDGVALWARLILTGGGVDLSAGGGVGAEWIV